MQKFHSFKMLSVSHLVTNTLVGVQVSREQDTRMSLLLSPLLLPRSPECVRRNSVSLLALHLPPIHYVPIWTTFRFHSMLFDYECGSREWQVSCSYRRNLKKTGMCAFTMNRFAYEIECSFLSFNTLCHYIKHFKALVTYCQCNYSTWLDKRSRVWYVKGREAISSVEGVSKLLASVMRCL